MHIYSRNTRQWTWILTGIMVHNMDACLKYADGWGRLTVSLMRQTIVSG